MSQGLMGVGLDLPGEGDDSGPDIVRAKYPDLDFRRQLTAERSSLETNGSDVCPSKRLSNNYY
jgi:hypothetical protein